MIVDDWIRRKSNVKPIFFIIAVYLETYNELAEPIPARYVAKTTLVIVMMLEVKPFATQQYLAGPRDWNFRRPAHYRHVRYHLCYTVGGNTLCSLF